MIKTGEVIQINDAANDGLQSLTVYGATRQNLWSNPSGTKNGVTVTANANGSITLSGTPASTTSFRTDAIYVLRPGTTYTASINKNTPAGILFSVLLKEADDTTLQQISPGRRGESTSATFTVPTDGFAYVKFDVFFNEQAVGQTVSGTYRVMLREATEEEIAAAQQTPSTLPEGGTADLPQDYPVTLPTDPGIYAANDDFDWCPPGINGVDELSIVTAGKNLASTSESSAANFQLVDYFLPAGEYTLSIGDMPDGFAFNLRAPRYLGVGTSNDNVLANVRSSVTTFTLDYASPLYINGYSTPATPLQDIQLEAGSTATAYEPPSIITETPVPLDGHSLNALPDGTRDELTVNEAGEVTLTQRVGVADLSGATWAQYQTNGAYVSTNALSDNYSTSSSISLKAFLCDALPTYPTKTIAKYTWEDNGPNGISPAAVGNGNLKNIYVRETSITSPETAVSFFEANPTKVLYPLATPKEVELPGVSVPRLEKRTPTVIFAASTVPAEMELDYRRWRQGADGFRVGRRHSFWTEGQCIASSNSGAPEKKSSTKTVPYMSGFYDFSAVYGAVAFESRELQYRFELVGDDMADLQEQKSALLNWIATVQDQDIFDDTVPGWHYRGSFDSADWEEGDEGESGALDVTFLCQPFLIADEETSQTLAVGTRTVTNGGQAVNPYASVASGTGTVILGGITQSVGTTPVRLSGQLLPGDNQVQVSGSSVTLTWQERRI